RRREQAALGLAAPIAWTRRPGDVHAPFPTAAIPQRQDHEPGQRPATAAPRTLFRPLRRRIWWADAPYFFPAACFSRNSLIICSCVALGTGWYLANSIENSPLPCVAERRSVEYPNISESGTCAVHTAYPSTVSVAWM